MTNKKSVLIVDDAQLIQKQLANLFTSLDFQVCGFANDGLEAIDAFTNLSPDLVSIDIILPHMHGVDLFRNLKARNPDLKCLFISSLEQEEIESALEGEISPNLFLKKPTSLEALQKAIQFLFPENIGSKAPQMNEDIPVDESEDDF